jgi:single-strand DNA-binding protein
MSLPSTSGRGFIISPEIEFKFLPSGQAVANFAVAFNKSKKNEQTGGYDRTHEVVYNCTAWGELAEFIRDKFESKTEIDLVGEAYQRKYQRQDGSDGVSLDLTVRQVGAPVAKREARSGGQGAGGGDPWGKAPSSHGGY